MILLTGITGRVGGSAAKFLLQQGVSVRGITRDPSKAKHLSDQGVEVVKGDLLDTESVHDALKGVNSALLVTSNNEKQLEMECGFATAAALAGAGHLVKISSMEAGPDTQATFPQIHYKAEQFIKTLGLRSTLLRPSFYMQNLLMYAQPISKANSFTLPMGKIKTGMVDARDIGEIAAHVLMNSARESTSHVLTGPDLMDFYEVAARMSAVLGREISYIEQSPADYRSFLEKVIPNAWHANAVCELFEQIAAGSLESITEESASLLGRKPTSIEQFVSDYVQAFSS